MGIEANNRRAGGNGHVCGAGVWCQYKACFANQGEQLLQARQANHVAYGVFGVGLNVGSQFLLTLSRAATKINRKAQAGGVVGNGRVALRQPVPLGVRGGGGDDQVFAGTGVELGFGPVPVFRIHRNVPGGGFKRNAQRFLELSKII